MRDNELINKNLEKGKNISLAVFKTNQKNTKG